MLPRQRRHPLLVTIAVLTAGAASASRPYRGGAVATAHPAATAAAVKMLDQGGNATDAAVAAAFTLAVVAPYHSGLGGGGVAVVHDRVKNEQRFLEFREVAPKAATRDMYLRDGKVVPGLSTDGGLAVGVPGAVAGYLELHARHGRLKLRDVLAPAIAAARGGFWVTPVYQSVAATRLECLRQDPGGRSLFLSPAKSPGEAPVAPAVGQIIRNPEMARTLELLVQRGAKGFYEGPVARAIAESVQARGGLVTVEDLKAYRARWGEPVTGTYRGHRVVTAAPPSAGGVALVQILGVMERAFPAGVPYRDVEGLHVLGEAMRRAYYDRWKYLGDPRFVDVPLQRLLSPQHLDQLARSIDRTRATASAALLGTDAPDGGTAAPGESPEMQKHTSHLSVVDRDGNAVGLTTTVNGYFGSCVVARGHGFVLNNQMDDFTAKAFEPNQDGLVNGENNAIAPGKVPLTSMTPTMVFQKDRPGEVMLVAGTNGGSTIPTTVTQLVLNVVDAGMDVDRALGLGRIHHQMLPDKLWVDQWGVEPATAAALEARGHSLRRVPLWAAPNAVLVDPATGLRFAASDPRREGTGGGQD
jgi:gamma-glutamyltranspeptidase/glutathione hydrolase